MHLGGSLAGMRSATHLDAVGGAQSIWGNDMSKGRTRGPHQGIRDEQPSVVWDVVARDWETLVWDVPNINANHPEKPAHPCQ